MRWCAAQVRFREQSGHDFSENPLSRSLLGVERTSLFAAHISAPDPKRTPNGPSATLDWYDQPFLVLGAAMKRREFIRLAGAAAAWPIAVRAQQSAMPLIGVLMNRAENDPDGKARLAAFLRALEESGWAVNRNVRMETRWGAEDVELERKYAAELVALSPDTLLAAGTLGVSAVLGGQPHSPNCVRWGA